MWTRWKKSGFDEFYHALPILSNRASAAIAARLGLREDHLEVPAGHQPSPQRRTGVPAALCFSLLSWGFREPFPRADRCPRLFAGSCPSSSLGGFLCRATFSFVVAKKSSNPKKKTPYRVENSVDILNEYGFSHP